MKNTISIYVHIPFCDKKCNYCDFYSIPKIIISEDLIKKYIDSLINELNFYAPLFEFYDIQTIYFGGGTPNSVGNYYLDYFLDSFFNNLLKSKNNILEKLEETTIELNPQFASTNQINIIKKYPINRISLGVQALDEKGLLFLGRNASFKQSIEAINIVLSNFDNVSLDFILGIPSLNIKKELKKIVNLTSIYKSLNHLSFYILTIAEGTVLYNKLYYDNFSKNKNRKNNLLDRIEAKSVEDYLTVCEYLKKLDFQHYEISNFSKEGKYSKHNLRYWDLKPYIGIGSSAHSYIFDLRYQNTCIKDYLSVWEKYSEITNTISSYFDNDSNKFIISDEQQNDKLKNYLLSSMKLLKRSYEIIDNKKKMNEYILLKLRMKDGIDLNEFKNIFFIDLLNEKEKEITKYLEKNFIKIKKNRLSIEESAFIFYNEIVQNLIF
ncbi:MAG TPA: coproporphyrinogen-III oxidase family protein [Exilispira sp.]|nr:coproporphyrinogen-III oxidase family protein [Exilispira sp.]